MPNVPMRYRLLLALFIVAGYFTAGNAAQVIHILLHEAEAPDASVPVRLATREFGSEPYFRWKVLTIDGQPFTQGRQIEATIRTHHPGEQIAITLQSPTGEIKQYNVPVGTQIRPNHRAIDLIVMVGLSLFLQIFCFGVGFAVAGIRPHDPLAWLLLGLLLSFSQTVDSFDWHWPLYAAALLWHVMASALWPVCMMLFGLFFPHRSVIDRSVPWLKWVLIALVVIPSAIVGATILTWRLDVDASLPLRPYLGLAGNASTIAGMLAISVFFARLGFSSGAAKDRDSRRRLAYMWAGAGVSLTPVFLLALYKLFSARDMFMGVPEWVVFTALLLLPIFPLTLAYVIVVQRAMNLKVALRLGLQYALARRGLRILQLLVVGGMIYLIVHGVQREMQTVDQMMIIGGGIIALGLQRQMALKVSNWIDRVFFREAYSTDRILIELSEQVRQFTETRPLLETITERIALTLHIPRAAVLLRDGDNYCLARTSEGFDPTVRCLPLRAHAIEHISKERKPALVYFDDQKSWVNLIEPEEKRRLQALDAQVLVALSGREDLIGVMVLGPKQSQEPYSGNDLRLLQSVGAQAGLALENTELLAKLSAEAAKRERINRELEIAHEVQERLFPQDYPPIAGVDYCGYCRPALGIGGDYYDFIHLKSGKLGIAVGDVSGKGVSAALLMSNLHASLRGQTMAQVSDLSVLMRNINVLMYEASTSNRYATFFYGEYDPATRLLQFVNAGHNAPMLVRGAECIRLEAGGPVVGLLKQAEYQQMSFQLQPGDILVGYTDGISEAMTVADEEWGEERMLEAIAACRERPAREMIEIILQGADTFTAGAPQYDDMTLSVAKVQ